MWYIILRRAGDLSCAMAVEGNTIQKKNSRQDRHSYCHTKDKAWSAGRNCMFLLQRNFRTLVSSQISKNSDFFFFLVYNREWNYKSINNYQSKAFHFQGYNTILKPFFFFPKLKSKAWL